MDIYGHTVMKTGRFELVLESHLQKQASSAALKTSTVGPSTPGPEHEDNPQPQPRRG